ncbi:hypothetical protein Goari_022897 [Gossypium aridum]|uniref:Uncharacterized protein n=1 Tax=Gossypium aridum TaxID=34290 RepID=A0A7J8YSZ3_GOSAI|nr:hypothetical protein [Gossypium aridum]
MGENMSRVTKEIKAKAEVYYGDETCREKFVSLLEEKGFPIGLLTFQDIQECGYDAEITAYFEPKKIKNLTGVKAKEFLIWITLTDIYVDQSSSITFKTNLVGLSKSFPVSVFNV